MINNTKMIMCFLTFLVGVAMHATAIDYISRVDVKYMFEDDSESVHTLTTDSRFTVGTSFFLMIDITISVPNSKLPLFAQRNINCGISFYSPQIVKTSIVQGGGGIHIDNKYAPNVLYAFKVPVQPTVISKDNTPVSFTTSTIGIRCEPINAGKQEIYIIFDRLFIDKSYNKNYVVTVYQ